MTTAAQGGIQYHHVFENLYVVPGDRMSIRSTAGYIYVEFEHEIQYIPFTDDFGPMNLQATNIFCNKIEVSLEAHSDHNLAVICNADSRSVTNAVFLLGSFLIMKQNYDIQAVIDALEPIMSKTVSYRDVSPGQQNFNLFVEDCWRGLCRAKQLSWVNFRNGSFDEQEYASLDNPLNADMHEVVPGKFIAMRGPRDLPEGRRWVDVSVKGQFSHRNFSPQHHAEILRQFGVQAVVRLNEPQYARSSFTDAGIAVADLSFEDCTPPPVDVAAKFLAIAEALPGALAVHCKAGLGRTGTLIALYMMKHHGFTAREAMGWLRIVRPGSVIGEQQDFLCAREGVMRKSAAPLRPAGVGALAGDGVEAVQRLIDETVRAYDKRYAAAMAAQGRASSSAGHKLGHSLSTGLDDSSALAVHVAAAAEQRASIRIRML
jgi:cell division cycle 14